MPLKSDTTFHIDRDSFEPAYSQLVYSLRQRIAYGEFPPGSRLPSEAQLCRQYQVSPMTVRRAVNLLLDQGVVDTAQGKGTFVKSLELGSVSFHLRDIQEIFRDRENTRVRLLDVRIVSANGETAQRLDVPAGERIIYISRLIDRHGSPLFYHRQYLRYDPRQPVVEAEMDLTSLGGLLSGSGSTCFKKGLLDIGVSSLDEEEAKFLEVQSGLPVFRLEHTFYDVDDRPASWGWFLFRGDQLHFSAWVGFWD